MTPTEAREEALKFMRDDLGFDFETEKARGFILGPCTMRDRGEVDDLAKLLLSAYERGRREGIEASAQMAEAEPELPGPMPETLFLDLVEILASGKRATEEQQRSVVRVCKRNIASTIRSLVKPEEVGK